MVESLVGKDFVVLLFYSMLFGLAVVKFRGFSNIVLLVLRDRKISYVDEQMKRLDDNWFDFQLFKVKHGINVCSLKDARIIQQGLVEGGIESSCFSFAGAWGDITKMATFKEMLPTYLLAFFILLLGVGGLISQYEFNFTESGRVKMQLISLIYCVIGVLMFYSIHRFKKANKVVLDYYKRKNL